MERIEELIRNAHKVLEVARQVDDIEAIALMEERIASFERMLRGDGAEG